MWQLKATRPNSQSSRKSATTSLDQSCPMTSVARHSLLCSYFSQSKKFSLAEQELIHSALTGQPCLPHVFQVKSIDTTRHSFTLCCQKVHNNQRARLERFRRDKGIGRAPVRKPPAPSCQGRKRARHAAHTSLERSAHTVPRVQARPDAFPKRPSPHSFAKSWCSPTCRPLLFTRLPTAPVMSLIFFPICSLCELDHGIPLSCPWLHSFLTFTRLLGSCCPAHLSVVTVQLFSFCPFNSFVNRRASPHQPAAAPICRPQCGQLVMQAFSAPPSSALNVNSSAPSLVAASGYSSLKVGFWTFNGFMPLRK